MTRVKKSITAAVLAEKPEIDLKAAADACFDANPDAEYFYQTSDGQCFAEEAFATRHAKTLEDNEVNLVTREEEENEEEPQA